MRILGKLLALPFALALTLATLILTFFQQIAGTVLNILCVLFTVAALFSLLIEGDAWGVQGLIIAFCISPCGLPLLAELALEGLGGLCGSMWGYIIA